MRQKNNWMEIAYIGDAGDENLFEQSSIAAFLLAIFSCS